mmetsp:Transcript_15798/g.17665  ORF Transcript_15798/g.17665 Transcript_15798/m.17665 type:complete len:192 (-) Transcript_15798:740-1315(-)
MNKKNNMNFWKVVWSLTIASTSFTDPCLSYSFEPNPSTIALFTSQRGGGGLFSNVIGKVEGKRSEWAEKVKDKAVQLDEQTETTTKNLHHKVTKVKQHELEKAPDFHKDKTLPNNNNNNNNKGKETQEQETHTTTTTTPLFQQLPRIRLPSRKCTTNLPEQQVPPNKGTNTSNHKKKSRKWWNILPPRLTK